MFPITHIWFSRKVLGYINNMTVLGSIFPDTAISGFLVHEQTHKVGLEFYDFFEDKFPEYIDFAKGVVTHTINPRGLDFYADEEYGRGAKGYCFQKAEQIEKEVINACNIPEAFGLWKAHNFIEMGIELNLAESEKALIDRLHDGLIDNSLINALTCPLETYFGMEKLSVVECMKRFSGFVELTHLNSTTLAQKYNRQMQAKHGISINIEECGRIIERSRVIVKDDFNDFAEFCTEKVKKMLKGERHEQGDFCNRT